MSFSKHEWQIVIPMIDSKEIIDSVSIIFKNNVLLKNVLIFCLHLAANVINLFHMTHVNRHLK